MTLRIRAFPVSLIAADRKAALAELARIHHAGKWATALNEEPEEGRVMWTVRDDTITLYYRVRVLTGTFA